MGFLSTPFLFSLGETQWLSLVKEFSLPVELCFLSFSKPDTTGKDAAKSGSDDECGGPLFKVELYVSVAMHCFSVA